MNLLEEILQQCARSAPNPWYPSAFAQQAGVARDSLDQPLEQLRMAGLIGLTDWVQGTGQGYRLTPEGAKIVESPKLLARLREGQVPVLKPAAPMPAANRELQATTWNRGEAAREALLSSDFTPFITFGLIFVNLAVFFAGLALAQKYQVPLSDYLEGRETDNVRHIQDVTGFLRGSEVYGGQWWRLLTNCFAHIGWMHLAANMYSLYAVGPLLERIWGHGRFLLLYLIAGLGGSCGMILENPVGGGAGASGAIFGILGSFVTWLFLNRGALSPTLVSSWRRQLIFVFGLNILITFAVPFISKGAHFGGCLVGLLTAVPLDYLRFGRPLQRRLALVALIAIPVASVGIAKITLDRNVGPINFVQNLWPQCVDTEREVVSFHNEELAPFMRRARKADPEEVHKVLQEATRKHEKLVTLEKEIERAGPFREPKLEAMREECRKALKQHIGVFEDAIQFLRTIETGRASGENPASGVASAPRVRPPENGMIYSSGWRTRGADATPLALSKSSGR